MVLFDFFGNRQVDGPIDFVTKARKLAKKLEILEFANAIKNRPKEYCQVKQTFEDVLKSIEESSHSLINDAGIVETHTTRPDLILSDTSFDYIQDFSNGNYWTCVIPDRFLQDVGTEQFEFKQYVETPDSTGKCRIQMTCSPEKFEAYNSNFYNVLDGEIGVNPYRQAGCGGTYDSLRVPLLSKRSVDDFILALEQSYLLCPEREEELLDMDIIVEIEDYLSNLHASIKEFENFPIGNYGQRVFGEDFERIRLGLDSYVKNCDKVYRELDEPAPLAVELSVVEPLVDYYRDVEAGKYGEIERR